ncbi:arginyl-tRNA--protein transferase 2-like [Humulus lupulus]|uniref:arginyl-tRNA--protein transferase 2-like n=1 Tax=Humulus lupulus TaxID=3486 RepID=UPI002B40DEE7|nr:arginyl-tRNA--protein transferase 2-like [Humulus lupulus]
MGCFLCKSVSEFDSEQSWGEKKEKSESEMAGKMKSEASSSSRTRNNIINSGRGASKVADCGRNRSSCGYCKSRGPTSISHGLWAHSLSVNDYQDLLDRGWRRSGSFLYKPEMERTCCPSYTIRLRAADFSPSKEQLRVARRLQRFLDGNLDSNKAPKQKEDSSASKETHSCADPQASSSEVKKSSPSNGAEKTEGESLLNSLTEKITNAIDICIESGLFPNDIQLPKACVKKVSQGKRKLFVEGSETLLYTSNIAFQIASAIKRAKQALEHVHQPRISKDTVDEKELSPKTIAEKLASSLNQLAETSGLSVKACNGHINFYLGVNKAYLDGSSEIVSNSEGSATRHESKVCSSENNYDGSSVKRRRLEIHMTRSSFDPEEFALYRRYQINVHNDSPDRVTESSYRRFLVDSPLIFVPPTSDGTVPPCGFGSFHQRYVIDGQLVAVGVIDILPRCLSSKYLFWDPDFAFLSLGKYSALQEINWVKENQIHCPSLQFYYLGYYIHSCNKMRYKAAYRPSELLCPLRYEWVSFDVARPFLDRKAYVVLSDCAALQDGESSAPNAPEQAMEVQHHDNSLEDTNDVLMHQMEEMDDAEYDSSDIDSGGESSDPESIQVEDGDIGNLLIGMRGTCMKYKDLQRAFGARERGHLESQLRRYLRVVGKELGEQMVYSLG